MSKIVAIHGIAQQVEGEDTLSATWLPALRSGLRRAKAEQPEDKEFSCAFYGDLFRQAGERLGDKAIDFAWEADDVTDPWERDLLRAWWEEAARIEREVPPPDERGKATPQFVQSALNALSHSKFFAGIAERLLIGNLKQVSKYFRENPVRATVQERVADWIAPDTKVLIGHSLGSIVAYEALCAHPDWPVRTLVTLGSPLGIRNLIFERLRPAPVNGKGAWPRSIVRWVNVSDRGDIVALSKELGPMFNISDGGDIVALREALGPMFKGAIEEYLVDNDANAHDVKPYLTAVETGRAIAAGLTD